MEWNEIELSGGRTTTFPELPVPWFAEDQEKVRQIQELDGKRDPFLIGGVIFNGKWCWLTRRNSSDAILLICCLKTGFIIARHVFWNVLTEDEDNQSCCTIRCVEELFPNETCKTLKLLAVCLETWTRGDRINTTETHLAIYSVKYNEVFRHIHLDGILASTLTFLNSDVYWQTHLHNFDGCLAVGSEDGTILLLDLNFQYLLTTRKHDTRSFPETIPNVQIERLAIDSGFTIIDTEMKKCREEDNHLALDVKVASSPIRSLVVPDLMAGFVAGLKNGQIVLYDLRGLKLFATLKPPEDFCGLPIERLCCIIPPDDPKPCFYLCAIYQSKEKLLALLHVVSFRQSYNASTDDRCLSFEQYQSSLICACIPLDGPFCTLIGCSTASTTSIAGDIGTLVVMLSWYSQADERNKLLLFDINQWYKDEMPYLLRFREKPNCLAGYMLSERRDIGISLHLKPSSILHFDSLQRYDVHLYPSSLTFDCCLLTIKGYRYYAHNGLQIRFINSLRQQNATIFLNPQVYHEDIIRLRLIPQFSELHASATYSRMAMYEELLSVALEQKCIALLYNCARSWLDDSFLCNMVNPTELSLSTLTNWIVKRANYIKARCLELSHGIFDYNGYSLDERERKEFQVLSSQLRNLLELQSYIIKQGKSVLAASVLQEYKTNENFLQMVYQYQWLLFWFMERELLPEGNLLEQPEQGKKTDLKQLQRDYNERRIRTNTAGIPLYIDTLLRRNELAAYMCEGQYPPSSLQAIMRMMLSSDAQLEQKHEVVLYLLMDLDRANKGVTIKVENIKQEFPQEHHSDMKMMLSKQFQLFFNVKEQTVKSVKSFWNLDRGDYWQAIDGLYDGRCRIRHYEDWQMKLLIDNLLSAGASRLAMRLVVQPPGPISFSLYLRVLLANDRIPEAFHYARLYDDENGRPLLEHFFRHCIDQGKFKVFAELCLREDEEQIIYRLLRECKTYKTDSVHLILLLQKCKYVEAVSFMDEIAVERQQEANEASNNILSAFKSTMAPVSQFLAGTYFQIRNKLESRNASANSAPEPFSCQLVKQSPNDMVGGIFRSSALSTHWATTTYDNACDGRIERAKRLSLSSHNVPFLRTAQYRGHIGDGEGNIIQHRRHVVRSVPYQAVEKRHREKQELDHHKELSKTSNYVVQPRKKRRLLGEQLISDLHEFVNQKKLEQKQLDSISKEDAERAGSSSVTAMPQPRSVLKRHTNTSVGTSQVAERPILSRENISTSSIVAKKSILKTKTAKRNTRDFYFTPPIPLDSLETVEQPEEDETDEIIMEIESRSGQQQNSKVNNESNDSEKFLSPNLNLPDTDEKKSKYLYFPPPIPLDATETKEQPDEDEGETDEIIVEIESRGSRQNRNANSASDEDDEFLSPLTSANVSLVPQEEEVQLNQSQPIAPPTGPQPRHSLLQGRTESSSGFGSFNTLSMRLAHTASSRDFVPTVCSSKMGETYVKISERTTICGDTQEMSDPSQMLVPSSTTLGWSLRSATTGTRPRQLPEMLDTTLGMSSYDITSLDQRQEGIEESATNQEQEEPIESMDIEEVDVERQPDEIENRDQQTIELDEDMGAEQEEKTIEEEQQAESTYDHPFLTASRELLAASEEPVSITNEEQLSSPTYSISSELSDMSSSEVRPLTTTRLRDDPMYSIVVESTGSITTSRSVTHTPTSFLPSDTNVSQNSSPRAAHGNAGSGPGGLDASPRSLYRANSLETVDDLDTTKGSLDDDDDEEAEDEDDCVIALDGTEVRGYVPRPQQTTACSSAELFAFKDEDAAASGSARPNPSLSLGATVNSDSVVAETINLDTDEDEEKDNVLESELKMEANNEKVVSDNDDSCAIVVNQPLERIQEEIEEISNDDSQVIVVQRLLEVVPEKPEEEISNDEPLPLVVKQQSEQIQEELSSEDDSQVIPHTPKFENIQEKKEAKSEAEDIQEECENIQEKEEAESKAGYKPKSTYVQEENIQEKDKRNSEDIPAITKQPLEEIQEEEEEPEVPVLKEIPEENDEEVAMYTKNEENDPPLKLAFSEDENEPTTVNMPTPIRTLRSHGSPKVDTPPVEAGMGLRRLKRRLSTASPIPLQSPSSRITRASSTPPAATTPSRSVRRLSSHKQLFEAIEENSRDATQSPGPQTRSRSRLSLEAEQAQPPQLTGRDKASTPQRPRTTKRASSTALEARQPAPTNRRKLRSSSEPPTPVKEKLRILPETSVPAQKKASKRRPSASDELRRATRAPSEAGDQAPSTSGRTLRRRNTNTELENTSSPSQEIQQSPTTDVNNEANVPPKKRGRAKK